MATLPEDILFFHMNESTESGGIQPHNILLTRQMLLLSIELLRQSAYILHKGSIMVLEPGDHIEMGSDDKFFFQDSSHTYECVYPVHNFYSNSLSNSAFESIQKILCEKGKPLKHTATCHIGCAQHQHDLHIYS